MTRDDSGRDAYDDHEVDMTVAPDRMVSLRDAERDRLVDQYHRLRIRARTYRKGGYRDLARYYEMEAERARRMVSMLDNPMAALRWRDRSGNR